MRKILAAVIAAAGLTFLCSFGVLASEVFQTVTSPSDGCSLVAVEGFYNSDTDVALDRINQIRYEACQEGVPDPGDPSKSLTPDDYVPIQWSSSLEYIARVRAAEASICRSHTRPNNQLCFTVTAPDGMRTYGENLAWNYSSTMFSGVNQWYREKTYWVTQDTSQETGHYTSMIDPDNRYVGLASFTNPGAAYPNTVSGEFDGYFTHNTDMLAELRDVRVILDVSTSALSDPTLQIRAQSQEHSGPPDRNDTIEYGLMLTATFPKGSGRVFDVGDITWSSSNPGVATVDGNGKAVINGVGETVIQARSQNGLSAITRLRAAHSPQSIEGVAPTCTEPGLTEGSKCSVCGVILTEQTEIPATGIHTWNAGEVTVAPTIEAEGLRTYTCTVCGEKKEETIDKLTVEPDPVLGTVATLEERAENLSENGDPAGSTFQILQAKSKKVGKSAITIAWKPVPNAAGYLIFGAPCGNRYGKLDEVKAANFTQSGLKKGTYYKYFVSAYDEYGNILASSKTIHIATAGGKKGNTKAVRLNKKKVPLKTGKTFKLKATLKNGKLKVKNIARLHLRQIIQMLPRFPETARSRRSERAPALYMPMRRTACSRDAK